MQIYPCRMCESCNVGTGEISIWRNIAIVKIYKVLLLYQDSNFNVVAAIEMLGQNVQFGLCRQNMEYFLQSTELSSFNFGWAVVVKCLIRNAVEAEVLTV